MESLEQTIEICQVAQPSTFFRLSAIRQVQGVPEDLHYIMDGEMWVKLLLQFGQAPFSKINKALVNFRIHENSKTTSNQVENNFLYVRSSIIIDLQRFVGVPEEIINYNISKVYQTRKLYELNREWRLNDEIISAKKLRIYFIQQYLNRQFILKNRSTAWWSIKELAKNRSFNISFFRNIIKLIVKF
jgi:hypothetical protein